MQLPERYENALSGLEETRLQVEQFIANAQVAFGPIPRRRELEVIVDRLTRPRCCESAASISRAALDEDVLQEVVEACAGEYPSIGVGRGFSWYFPRFGRVATAVQAVRFMAEELVSLNAKAARVLDGELVSPDVRQQVVRDLEKGWHQCDIAQVRFWKSRLRCEFETAARVCAVK